MKKILLLFVLSFSLVITSGCTFKSNETQIASSFLDLVYYDNKPVLAEELLSEELKKKNSSVLEELNIDNPKDGEGVHSEEYKDLVKTVKEIQRETFYTVTKDESNQNKLHIEVKKVKIEDQANDAYVNVMDKAVEDYEFTATPEDEEMDKMAEKVAIMFYSEFSKQLKKLKENPDKEFIKFKGDMTVEEVDGKLLITEIDDEILNSIPFGALND